MELIKNIWQLNYWLKKGFDEELIKDAEKMYQELG